MAINVNGSSINAITVNDSTEIKEALLNNSYIWAKPYTLTLTNNSSNYVSISKCYRDTTREPTAGTGEGSGNLSNGSTIYYYDTLYVSATLNTTTRYMTRSASPVTFSSSSSNYIYGIDGNETIVYNSISCTCGQNNVQSTCTSCASTSCSSALSGMCTTTAHKKCNCRTTSISGGDICNCAGISLALT